MVGAMPFSVLTLPELLLGELGPEPGALLHAESVGEKQQVGVGHWRDRAPYCFPGFLLPSPLAGRTAGFQSRDGNMIPSVLALLLTSHEPPKAEALWMHG